MMCAFIIVVVIATNNAPPTRCVSGKINHPICNGIIGALMDTMGLLCGGGGRHLMWYASKVLHGVY